LGRKRQIEIRVNATYSIDTTEGITTNIFVFNESKNKNVIFDTASVNLQSGKLLTKLAAFYSGVEEENLTWYIFDTREHRPVPGNEWVFKLKIDALIDGRKENLVKDLNIKPNNTP
jgi:hypothetical protein